MRPWYFRNYYEILFKNSLGNFPKNTISILSIAFILRISISKYEKGFIFLRTYAKENQFMELLQLKEVVYANSKKKPLVVLQHQEV